MPYHSTKTPYDSICLPRFFGFRARLHLGKTAASVTLTPSPAEIAVIS
jgi:hypothetical protein